jgi:hypothetical protein
LRKFILIDHSLRDQSGHHYPYAASVMQAAAAAGFRPVLASHRDFAGGAALRPEWPRYAVFNRPSYSRHALDTQLARPLRLRALRAPWATLQRFRHAREFAAGLGRLFGQCQLAADDVVFLATASELDCAGLTRFLAANPAAAGAYWHLQLHFGIYRTRPFQYANATGLAAAARLRRSLARSLARVPRLSLRFHCTTEELTAQYQPLGIAGFHTLPYPVHELFSAPRDTDPQGAGNRSQFGSAKRVACLGHARREKGQGHLPALLKGLWDGALADGSAQLVLQSPKPAMLATLQSQARALGNDAAVAAAPAALDMASYAALVRSTDIGVLLYDGLRYYDRCSGILLELLAAGVPVVVPAACWLSRQIEGAEAMYLDIAHEEWLAGNRLYALPLPATDIQFKPGESLALSAAVPAGCRTLLFSCRGIGDVAEPGWLRIRCGGQSLTRVVPLPRAAEQRRVLLRTGGAAGTLHPGAGDPARVRAERGSWRAVAARRAGSRHCRCR